MTLKAKNSECRLPRMLVVCRALAAIVVVNFGVLVWMLLIKAQYA